MFILQCTTRIRVAPMFENNLPIISVDIFLLHGISGVDDIIRYLILILIAKLSLNKMRN